VSSLKVALICTEKLPVPPIAGGAVQLYIDGIVPYLSKQHDISVFGVQHPDLPNEEIKDNVKYIRVPGRTDTFYVNNIKNLLDNTYDLIHVFNRPRFLLSFMEKLPDAKFSLSLHNEMFHADKISDAAALQCIEKAEFINTVSSFIANTVKLRIPAAEKKLHVVYSGVDPDIYKPGWTEEGAKLKLDMKNKLGLKDYRVVLFVGRLSIKKGVHVILRAMEKVVGSHKNVALVVVGSKWYGKNDSDEYTRSLQTISQNLAGPIIFTGFIPPSGIPKYFSAGDVFVCASQWNEPLARVHYEAMAAGLPIITTNRGGNAEVVDGYDNGIVLDDYKDPEVMAGHISYLLDNPEKALEMGMNGRKLRKKIQLEKGRIRGIT
jgi:spore coat protein SA